MKNCVLALGMAAVAVFGVSEATAAADPWTDGQVQWENCKQAGHTDGQCRQMLDNRPAPAPAPHPPTGSAGGW
ncbi:hypothetical protein [Nocardia alni]|uniref:hypothetical protein n=1 Tax=Nocardia alni TaxID=2815723 RepID=UPI001C23DFDA|nr:hypothetical protein [Nocardia alni]